MFLPSDQAPRVYRNFSGSSEYESLETSLVSHGREEFWVGAYLPQVWPSNLDVELEFQNASRSC